jgi:hypothetical protein
VAVFGVIAEARFSSISVSSWTSTSIHRYQRAYAGAKAERIKKPMKTEALGAGRAPLLLNIHSIVHTLPVGAVCATITVDLVTQLYG